MALSFSTVQKAYEILHELKTVLPELRINSWPQDMAYFSQNEKDNPPILEVLGWGKKSDDGWESLTFFIKDPPQSLIDDFERLNTINANTSICEPYHRNESIWCIGWF